MQRRTFIRHALLGLGSAPLAATALASGSTLSRDPFSLGIASGDISEQAAVLWTRLAPDPTLADGGMPAEAFGVTWELSRDRSMSPLVRTGEELAVPQFAHSVHVELDGLDPNTVYYYRFRVGAFASPVGRTKTLPGPNAASIRFATASCQNFTHGYFVAYRHMLDDRPDFVIHLGDYLYETSFGETFRQHPGDEDPQTLAEFRRWHAHYKRDPFLQVAHAELPFFHCIDNHDAIADNDPERAAVRAAAYQAWYEHMPVRGYTSPGSNAFDQYRHIQIGDLAQICLLDSRQFRDTQAICHDYDPTFGFGNYRPRCAAVMSEGRSMLGDAQEQWLTQALRQNTAAWNVMASPGPFLPFSYQVGGQDLRYIGAWDNYPANRKRVAQAFAANTKSHPLVLSGDVHSFWAMDGRKVPWADERFAVSEFVTSSISANWPEVLAQPVTDNLSGNPQVRYYEPAYRGYLLHNVNPERWLCTFRAVDDVRNANAAVRNLAEFTVRQGEAGFETDLAPLNSG
ncbi:MAG: alkaline phosphatase PhoD [Congregibacter sp.]